MKSMLLAALALFLSLSAAVPAPGGKNTAVIPVPREGKPHDRFLLINERVKQSRGDADLVFVGDSITQGWEGNGKEVWQRYYGHRKALNLGIGGDQTQHVLWRLDNGNAEGLNPKAAVVMIGTNNSLPDRNTAEEMTEGVAAVVRKVREKFPKAKVLLLGIFPRGEKPNELRDKNRKVNQSLRRLDDGRTVHFLDIGGVFAGENDVISKEIMPDFLHLSAKGYELWAEAMENKLAELLGDKPLSPAK